MFHKTVVPFLFNELVILIKQKSFGSVSLNVLTLQCLSNFVLQFQFMKTIHLAELTPNQRYHYMLGTITPRPIALVSTISPEGLPNVAPYSFFNVFSGTPPVLIFSANTRSVVPAEKDSLANIRSTGEAVINLVNFSMSQQMALTGLEYPKGVNEFEKSGLTPVASQIVKPFRVQESPVHFECRLIEIKSMGKAPGSANLIIMEALLMHVNEDAILPSEKIDPSALDIVGRLGGSQYTRVKGDNVFSIPLPANGLPVGFEAIPDSIRKSKWLTGSDLAKLAGTTTLPDSKSLTTFKEEPYFRNFSKAMLQVSADDQDKKIHLELKRLIENKDIQTCWKLIMALEYQSAHN